MTKPTDEQIRLRAYRLWEEAGRPEGREEEFWHQAERDLQRAGDGGEFGPDPTSLLPG
jgi:hypothetical protein